MLDILTNTLKAVVAVVVTPVDIVVDAATLPSTAFDGKAPFERTTKRLQQAGKAIDAAIKPRD